MYQQISQCLKNKGIPLTYATFPDPDVEGKIVSVIVIWKDCLLELYEEKEDGLVYIDKFELKESNIENALKRSLKWIEIMQENYKILKVMGAE